MGIYRPSLISDPRPHVYSDPRPHINPFFKMSSKITSEQQSQLFLTAVAVIRRTAEPSLESIRRDERFAKKLSAEMDLVLAFVCHGHDDTVFDAFEKELGFTLEKALDRLDHRCIGAAYALLEARQQSSNFERPSIIDSLNVCQH